MHKEGEFEINVKDNFQRELEYNIETIVRSSEIYSQNKNETTTTQVFSAEFLKEDEKQISSYKIKYIEKIEEFKNSMPQLSAIAELTNYKIKSKGKSQIVIKLIYSDTGTRFQSFINNLKTNEISEIQLKACRDFLFTLYELYSSYQKIPILKEYNIYIKKDGSLSLIFFPNFFDHIISSSKNLSLITQNFERSLKPPELRKLDETNHYLSETNFSYTWAIFTSFCLGLLDPKEDFGCITDEDSERLIYLIRKKRDVNKIKNLNYHLVELIVECLLKESNLRFNLKELIFFFTNLGNEKFKDYYTECKLSKKNRLDLLKSKNLQMEKQVSITDEDMKDQDINPDILVKMNFNLEKSINGGRKDKRFLKRNYNLFEEFSYLLKKIIKLFKVHYFQDDTREFEIKNEINILSSDPHQAVKFIKDCFRKVIDEKNIVNIRFQKQVMEITKRAKKHLNYLKEEMKKQNYNENEEAKKQIGNLKEDKEKKQFDIAFIINDLIKEIESLQKDNEQLIVPEHTYKRLEEYFNNHPDLIEYKKYCINPLYLDLQDLELTDDIINKIANAINLNDCLETVIICGFDDFNKKLTGKTIKLTGEMFQKFSRGLQQSSNLRSIIIQNNILGNFGARIIAEIIKDKYFFECLNIYSNQIKESGAIEIFHSILKLPKFNTINIGYIMVGRNQIDLSKDKECVEEIINSFKLKELKSVDIGLLISGHEPMLQILKSMDSIDTLEFLNIEGSQISDSGKAIIEIIGKQFPNLYHINIGTNNFSKNMKKTLVDFVRIKGSLKQFRMGTNSLQAKGLKAILKNFKSPEKIDDLDISNNEIEEKEEVVEAIGQCLTKFKNLVQINLTGIAYNQIMLDRIIALCKAADMSCRIIIEHKPNN